MNKQKYYEMFLETFKGARNVTGVCKAYNAIQESLDEAIAEYTKQYETEFYNLGFKKAKGDN